LFFLGALIVGLLVSSDRRLLATKSFWIAAAIAFLIALPNVVWQYPPIREVHWTFPILMPCLKAAGPKQPELNQSFLIEGPA